MSLYLLELPILRACRSDFIPARLHLQVLIPVLTGEGGGRGWGSNQYKPGLFSSLSLIVYDVIPIIYFSCHTGILLQLTLLSQIQ